MLDLKEILYTRIAGHERTYDVESCLSYIEYYTFLGDYKDCRERLQKCKSGFLNVYGNVEKNIREANDPDTILAAVRILKIIREAEDKTGLPGEIIQASGNLREQIDRMIIIAADREEELKKKETRRKRTRKYGPFMAAVFFIIIVLFANFCYDELVPPRVFSKAEQQFSAGEYEKALSSFGSLSKWEKWEDEAEEGLRKTHMMLADRYMDERKFTLAIPHYHSAGEFEKEIDARRTAAEICMKKHEYEEGVRQYEELQDAEKEYLKKLRNARDIDHDPSADLKISALEADMADTDQKLEEARIFWSEKLEDDGLTYDAIRQLERVSRTPEINVQLKELYMEFADSQIESVKEYSEPNATYAGKLGRIIKEINAQLHYCDALITLGYDLAEVYPEGVWIDGMDLGLREYNSEGPEAEPPDGKMLVLYREEHDGYYSNNSLYSIYREVFGKENYKSKEYSFYLYPDLLYRLPKEKRASSWEDCDTLLMASSNYSFYKKVKDTGGKTNVGQYIYYSPTEYSSFICTDKISVFEKDYPYFHITIREKVNKPSIEDGFNAANIGRMNIDDKLFGRPDKEWIRKTLENVVADFGGEIRA